jgi:putative toxin-antitoxin system antitoxin component (TIGR02293 family)
MATQTFTLASPYTSFLTSVWRMLEGGKAAANALGAALPRSGAAAGGKASPDLNNDQAVRILKNGISFEVIAPLSDYFGMGKGEIYTILDFDRTTAMRRASKDQPLPKHVAENVLRILELQKLACDTFATEEETIAWLRRPHPMLEGESPLLAANTSFGTRRVKDILVAIQHGGVV